jgi:hypothetical protein
MAQESSKPFISSTDKWFDIAWRMERLLSSFEKDLSSPAYLAGVQCMMLARLGGEVQQLNESLMRIWSDTSTMKSKIAGYSIGEGVDRDDYPGMFDLVKEISGVVHSIRGAVFRSGP